MAVLASANHPEVCLAKYGATVARCNQARHEMSLRILLQTIETSALRYKRHIVPLVCCSIDYYVRVFVRVLEGPAASIKDSIANRCMCHVCSGCGSFWPQPLGKISQSTKRKKSKNSKNSRSERLKFMKLDKDSAVVDKDGVDEGPIGDKDEMEDQIDRDEMEDPIDKDASSPLSPPHSSSYQIVKHQISASIPVSSSCSFCSSTLHICGPMWYSAMHNKQFCDFFISDLSSHEASNRKSFNTFDRILGMVSLIQEELDTFLAFDLPDLSNRIRSTCPPRASFL